jgi:hypothetical protein
MQKGSRMAPLSRLVVMGGMDSPLRGARMNHPHSQTSQGQFAFLAVYFIRTLNSKGEPNGSPFSFGGDGCYRM